MDQPPSWALSKPASETVTALNETLSFQCAKSNCTVTAIYEVKSDVEQTLSFEFILPVKEKVTVKLGKADAQVAVSDTELLPESDKRSDFTWQRDDSEKRLKLYRATFEGKLHAGVMKMTVTYEQPLGAEERGHGYGSDGRMVKQLQYEVWPLKEWKRADTFGITVWVSMKSKKPGLFTSWFGREPSFNCQSEVGRYEYSADGMNLSELKSQPLSLSPSWNGDTLEGGFAMKQAVPDRLRCFLDDE